MDHAIAVEVISFCDAAGLIRPIRFRFEDEEQVCRTVQIARIVSTKQVQYVGREAFVYQCIAEQGGAAVTYELQYTVKSHQWSLLRIHPGGAGR